MTICGGSPFGSCSEAYHMARCGDVLWLFDGTAVRDRKMRMFVCLDPTQGWCARIVTRPPRHEPVLMERRDHRFLRHDSYVETGTPVEFGDDEIEEGRLAGRISADLARRMITAWERAEVAPPHARDAVIGHLREEFGIE